MLLEKAHSLNLYKSKVIINSDEKQVNNKVKQGRVTGQAGPKKSCLKCPSE